MFQRPEGRAPTRLTATAERGVHAASASATPRSPEIPRPPSQPTFLRPEGRAPGASRARRYVRGLLLALACLLAAPLLLGQLPPGSSAQGGIKFPEYDKQTQRLKSLLTGQTAVQQPNGEVLVNSMRVEIYSYDGETRKIDVVVEAPSCTFDFKERVASSPGPLLLKREDGRLLVAGVGFQWRQSSSQLYISNKVQTVIARRTRGL